MLTASPVPAIAVATTSTSSGTVVAIAASGTAMEPVPAQTTIPAWRGFQIIPAARRHREGRPDSRATRRSCSADAPTATRQSRRAGARTGTTATAYRCLIHYRSRAAPGADGHQENLPYLVEAPVDIPAPTGGGPLNTRLATARALCDEGAHGRLLAVMPGIIGDGTPLPASRTPASAATEGTDRGLDTCATEPEYDESRGR
ncbi:hypothetical protein Srubr_37080 [Streptomyces rubradiris]|uniref:Uncharacterized protein n=1 Tax=Streptomyces rubradiris TaxID=285531 RepID=A0ABQ3RDC1_STRRR|nr:hypothetical protein GCM10018792_05990 [Streptomyces rubradiris]GHI53862.1 hypothetical protein Srubr_37080 [Streptomyces rubradiris]